jgi:arylsulfatase A-like enzyme
MIDLPPEGSVASQKQTRREWLGTSAAAAAVASAAGAQTGAVARPNIVLVISDQFRWDCIGAMGLNPMNLTPNLDRMAARGVLFRQAISNQPVCAPARASIFTGQYPSRHGVWKNALGLAEDATTLATVMKRAGYSTNYIGKWHLARPEAGSTAEIRGAVHPDIAADSPTSGRPPTSWSGPPTPTRAISSITTASPSTLPTATASIS